MRVVWPSFHCKARGFWIGRLRALDFSESYDVRIEYRVGAKPKVWVLGLPSREEESESKKIPHRFTDGSICLFYGDEWTADKSIARTIVPWLLEWLAFYEGWLVTGEWQGGGTHPTSPDQ
jgi:hypothetical protein